MLALAVSALGLFQGSVPCTGRVDLRTQAEWCSSDPARNADPALCGRHYLGLFFASRSCAHDRGVCRVGPPCTFPAAPPPLGPPPPAAPPTQGTVPADLCTELLFSKVRRNGTLGGEWCENAGIPAVSEFSEESRSRCERLYVDPVLESQQPYPGDCSGTCAPCHYVLNLTDRIFRCLTNPTLRLTDLDCKKTSGCTGMVTGRVDLRALSPPQWCSSPERDANPGLCARHYVNKGGRLLVCEPDQTQRGRCTAVTC